VNASLYLTFGALAYAVLVSLAGEHGRAAREGPAKRTTETSAIGQVYDEA
jgi:hypothetical protein